MNQLRTKRKELGITQIQAANTCGVSRRTYQTYEETRVKNETYDELYKKLEGMGIMDGSMLLSIFSDNQILENRLNSRRKSINIL